MTEGAGSRPTVRSRIRDRFRRPPAATLAPDVLGPEAIIDNMAQDPSRIAVAPNSFIRGRLLVFAHAGSITIGSWSYVGHRSEIWSAASVSIGDRVVIAHDVNIVDTTSHSLDPAERHAHYRAILTKGHPTRDADLPGIRSAPIVIEDDVWVSFGVTILKGVRIGAGSVIAAGSIVTHDVPARSLYRMDVRPVITPLDAG